VAGPSGVGPPAQQGGSGRRGGRGGRGGRGRARGEAAESAPHTASASGEGGWAGDAGGGGGGARTVAAAGDVGAAWPRAAPPPPPMPNRLLDMLQAGARRAQAPPGLVSSQPPYGQEAYRLGAAVPREAWGEVPDVGPAQPWAQHGGRAYELPHLPAYGAYPMQPHAAARPGFAYSPHVASAAAGGLAHAGFAPRGAPHGSVPPQPLPAAPQVGGHASGPQPAAAVASAARGGGRPSGPPAPRMGYL
jgi:hypothetical protein